MLGEYSCITTSKLANQFGPKALFTCVVHVLIVIGHFSFSFNTEIVFFFFVFFFQMYLRSWAKELDVPILSIDYSLSPEAPFPRALEECFFVYAWCLNNFDQLGTTGKFLCLAGDSAGM